MSQTIISTRRRKIVETLSLIQIQSICSSCGLVSRPWQANKSYLLDCVVEGWNDLVQNEVLFWVRKNLDEASNVTKRSIGK